MSVVAAPIEIPLWQRPAVRWAAALVAVIVTVNLVLIVVGAFVPEPSGRASSAYATSSRGLAAYAELLGRFGRPVTALRKPPGDADIPAGATVVLVDPSGPVGARDIAALRRVVDHGGRVIAGGTDSTALATALAGTRVPWSDAGEKRWPTSAALAGAGTVSAAAHGSYRCPATGQALAGTAARALVCAVRGGRVLLLADSSPLQNDRLGQAGNAALGIALAGGGHGDVVFVETVHGYASASGLSALPPAAWWAVGLLCFAGLALFAARWRRLGPAVAADVPVAPVRAEHVIALAQALQRAPDAATTGTRLRDAARATIARRAGLPPDTDEARLRAAASSLGVSAEDQDLLSGADASADTLTRLGRILAGLRSEAR